MYTVNLIRERASEQAVWVDTFQVDDSVKDPEKVMRSAVKEFLATEEGRRAIMYTSADFNWGDALNYIPNHIWNKHGLRIGTPDTISIKVDQDEVLC